MGFAASVPNQGTAAGRWSISAGIGLARTASLGFGAWRMALRVAQAAAPGTAALLVRMRSEGTAVATP